LAADARLVRVYDIANAGPRFRYTAGDKLVLNCVLGLGFQVGWKKLQSSLATNMVNLYRSDNAPIVNYWAEAELAIYDMYNGNQRQWGALQIYKNALIMPNGMALQYPHLRPSEPDEQGRIGWEYWNGKFFTNLYGGKLTENIVQALSRIVLFRQMLKIDTLFQSIHPKARVALSVHDEVVSVGPSFGAIYMGLDAKGKEVWSNTEGADALFDQTVQIMRTPEDWCLDLPLDGEGGFAFEYSK
jgi:DNA polymerase